MPNDLVFTRPRPKIVVALLNLMVRYGLPLSDEI